jgi:hypothetical protein
MVTQLQLPHPVPADVPSGYDNLFTLNTGNDSIAQVNSCLLRAEVVSRAIIVCATPEVRARRDARGPRN